jgi:hypothetical protein
MKRLLEMTLLTGLVCSAAPLAADPLGDAQVFLCTAMEVRTCAPDEECARTSAWALNVPYFIEVDLGRRLLSTTQASGENRTTPIKHVESDEGFHYLQGVEAGRAFSFVVNRETGRMTVSVARADLSVSAFGQCTPLPVRPKGRRR